MVDISHKEVTKRVAHAEGSVVFTPEAFKIFVKQGSPKGDVLATAKVAGILAAKNTPSLIPLCHPLALEKVSIEFDLIKAKNTLKVTTEVHVSGKTGVEMEALSAVSATCLTVYDMMKFTGQRIRITDIQLVHKSGGKTGDYRK